MKPPDIEKAVTTYYTKLEIGTSDICEIFSCGRNTALKLKKSVREEMARRGKLPFVVDHVSTKIAFEVWGLDVADLEGRLKKIRQLEGLK